jgi:hypothetical protein
VTRCRIQALRTLEAAKVNMPAGRIAALWLTLNQHSISRRCALPTNTHLRVCLFFPHPPSSRPSWRTV